MGHALENIVNDPQLLTRIRVQLKESTFLSQLFDNMSFEMARMRLDIFLKSMLIQKMKSFSMM